jgi:hypothetical protein
VSPPHSPSGSPRPTIAIDVATVRIDSLQEALRTHHAVL